MWFFVSGGGGGGCLCWLNYFRIWRISSCVVWSWDVKNMEVLGPCMVIDYISDYGGVASQNCCLNFSRIWKPYESLNELLFHINFRVLPSLEGSYSNASVWALTERMCGIWHNLKFLTMEVYCWCYYVFCTFWLVYRIFLVCIAFAL